MHNGYHINAESVYVGTISDDNSSNLSDGRPNNEGKIVITDLNNYGMPFIRYEIGDTGQVSDRNCSCGRGLPML